MSNLFYKNLNPLESFNVILESKYLLLNSLFINIIISFCFLNILLLFINGTIFHVSVIYYCKAVYSFLFNLFKDLVLNIRSERYFYIIMSVFILILINNLGGFSLYEVSLMSHIIITLFLSFIIFFNYFINIIINYNEHIYIKFIQNNLNLFLTVILFVIELVSFIVRPFSLGVRLFANILSGHVLMHIFFNAFLYFFKMFFWFSLLLFVFCLFVLCLEIFVSLVQAYIFMILLIIYLKDIIKLH